MPTVRESQRPFLMIGMILEPPSPMQSSVGRTPNLNTYTTKKDGGSDIDDDDDN